MNILIVDDEPFAMRPFEEELVLAGFSVDFRRSADEALEYIRERTPDVMIIDWLMPVGTGFVRGDSIYGGQHLLREVRKTHRELPVIVLSAMGSLPEGSIDSYTMFAHKASILPFELPELVRECHALAGEQ